MPEHRVESIPRILTRREAVLGAAALAVSSGHLTARAQSATPKAPPVSSAGSGGLVTLQGMLAQIPSALIPDDTDPAVLFFWADIASQFMAAGVDRYFPDIDGADPGPYLRLMQPLATASPLFSFANDTELTEALGFRADAVDQSLLFGQAGEVNVFRGGMSVDELSSAWERSGYEKKAAHGAAIWTLGDAFRSDSVIDQRLATAFNNASFLPSGDVVFTNTLDLITTIVTFKDGDRSVADDESMAPVLAAMPAEVASAIVTNSAFLKPREDGGDGTIKSRLSPDSKRSRPPEYKGSFAIGITAGFMNAQSASDDTGTPQPDQLAIIPDGGAIPVRLGLADADQARRAVDVISERWNSANSLASGLKYAEILEIIDTEVKDNIAGIDFLPLRNPSNWIDLVLQQDLLPFGPIEE